MTKSQRIVCYLAAVLFYIALWHIITEKELITLLGEPEIKCLGIATTGQQLVYGIYGIALSLTVLAYFTKKPLHFLIAFLLILAGTFIFFYFIPAAESQLPTEFSLQLYGNLNNLASALGMTLIAVFLGMTALIIGILMPLILIITAFQK